MADIIPFPKDQAGDAFDDMSDENHDMFLIDEGLELLAAYRDIKDPSVRASLMDLAKALAAATRPATRRT